MSSDILDRIDRAVGCQHCGDPLDDSVSDDFCDDWCQEQWHAARVVPLVGYREPDDLAVHIANLVEYASVETTPPHPSAGGEATNRWPRISVLHTDDLDTSRALARIRRQMGSVIPIPGVAVFEWRGPALDEDAVAENSRLISEAMAVSAATAGAALAQLARAFTEFDRVRLNEPQQGVDVRARALELRRNRNTGPTAERRTPRSLNPRGSASRK